MSHALAESEIEHLHHALRRDFDVGGLQIAMDDAFFVRGFQRFRDLSRDVEASSSGSGRRAFCALDQFHHQRAGFSTP